MIEGRMVNIRRLRISDLPDVYKWRQNEELMRYYDTLPVDSPIEIETEMYNNLNSINRQDFIIETKNMSPIGTIFLNDIDWKDRHAELQTMIGEKEKRHRAFGIEAELQMLIYAFHFLNLHKIYAQIIQYAQESKRLIEQAGFVQEAVFKKKFYQKGTYWDVYIYGLLHNEFNAFLKTPKAIRYLTRKNIRRYNIGGNAKNRTKIITYP